MLFYVCNCLQSGDWNVLIKSHQISPTFHWCRKAAKIGSLLRISTEIRKLSPSWAHSHLPFSSISQKVHVSNVWRSRLRSVRQNTWSICLPGNAPANDKCARCPHQEESNRNPIESAFNWYRVWFYPVEWLRAFPIHLPSSKLWSTNIDTMDSKCRKDQFHSAFCEHFVNRSRPLRPLSNTVRLSGTHGKGSWWHNECLRMATWQHQKCNSLTYLTSGYVKLCRPSVFSPFETKALGVRPHSSHSRLSVELCHGFTSW